MAKQKNNRLSLEERVFVMGTLDENLQLKVENESLTKQIQALKEEVSWKNIKLQQRAVKDERITRVILENRRLKKLNKGVSA